MKIRRFAPVVIAALLVSFWTYFCMHSRSMWVGIPVCPGAIIGMLIDGPHGGTSLTFKIATAVSIIVPACSAQSLSKPPGGRLPA